MLKAEKYSRLDDDLTGHDSKRQTHARWPSLEIALFDWQKRMQKETLAITGAVLQATAGKIWTQLAQFKVIPMPKWSTGWLDKFKRRYGIQQHTRHGEAASVNIDYVMKQLEELQELHDKLRRYANCDIYNTDETALYWMTIPDRTLATIQLAGRKVAKARITAIFCCNASGTDKLPIWFIGMAAKLWCFAAPGVNMSALDFVWRSKEKAR
jgi:hypothetical protein